MLRTMLLATLLAVLATPVSAEPLRVLTTGAFKPVLSALIPEFEAETGDRVEVINDTAGALAKRVEAGERFDLVVLTPAALEGLAAKQVVDPASVTPLARVGIGVAVRTGAALPEIDTVDRFRRTLLAARRIAYIDPASGGSSGIYLDGLFRRLGIADAVAAKAVLVPGGLVADRLVSGEADLALHQISEILPVKGVTLLGPLPESIQNYTEYAAGIAAASPHPQLARAFLARLSGTAAYIVISGRGMLPIR